MINPASAGHTQPNPCSENGRSKAAVFVILSITGSELMSSGSARRKSKTAPNAVKAITHWYTTIYPWKRRSENVRAISTIASGYRNISTGIEYAMIVLSPRFAIRKDSTQNAAAQIR